MSMVTFSPKPGTEYEDCWPIYVIGDGFINLTLHEIDYTGDDTALYIDQFKDEYEFIDCSAGQWTVEVREDG